MKTILIILTLAITAFAQSESLKDYELVYKDDSGKYYIDTTSHETVRNGNKVFWGMTLQGETLVLMSSEVNCRTKRFRIRAIIMAHDTRGVKGDYTPLTWMPKEDKVANAYISYVCGEINWASLPKYAWLPLIRPLS